MSPTDMVLTPKGLRFMSRLYPCSIGKGGISRDKREGDGATPRGAHHIVGMMYRPDRMARPVEWAVPLLPGDLWSDAPGDIDYNQLVRVPYAPSHEVLRRPDPLYDLILLTDWNWPFAVPGGGSAIFIHQWRRPGYPTEGCIGLRRDHLREVAQKITPFSRLIVR